MFIGENIVYLDLQKTGSTHIAKVLKTIPSENGVKLRKHITFEQVPMNLRQDWTRKTILGSIRNPWSWYVSLWAYGCAGKGSMLKNHTQFDWAFFKKNKKWDYLRIRRKKWRKVYGDVDDVRRFREWLRMVLLTDEMVWGFSNHPISRWAGLYTYRYARLYLKDFHKQGSWADLKTLQEYDAHNNWKQETIRMESLTQDLSTFLFAMGIEMNDELEQLLSEKNNTSHHRDYKDYYDKESISWVAEKDRFIIDKYQYDFMGT